MQEKSTVDRINRQTMSRSVLEYEYIVSEGLNAQELGALELVGDVARQGRILDLGMGAGRTVQPLRAIGKEYVGVDYTREMVQHCRERFPGVRFEHMDARDLTAFPAQSFDLVFFSCNGISMVDHAGRLSILSEALRVLVPGGALVFSTCNRNSPEFESIFRFPEFGPTLNPLKWAPRGARFLARTIVRARNRLRLKRHEVRTPEWAMLNDVFHNYSTMIYYIDVPNQLKQLEVAGFAPGPAVLARKGHLTDGSCRDGTIAFVARKPAA